MAQPPGGRHISENKVMAYGLRGNAYWSDDGAERWRRSETGTQATFTAGLALNDGSVVLVNRFRRLFLAGLTALLADAVGFAALDIVA